MKFRPAPATLRLLAVLALLLRMEIGRGVDFTPWARHLEHHRAWTSLDFRNPRTGMFFAARAGTEDVQSQATLTLTAMPAGQCQPDLVIVLNTGEPAPRNSEEPGMISVRWDNARLQHIRVLMVRQGGDSFVFARILGELSLDLLRRHKLMQVTLPGRESATFSLEGFDAAWSRALAICRSFLKSG